jgi:hypothetical protein
MRNPSPRLFACLRIAFAFIVAASIGPHANSQTCSGQCQKQATCTGNATTSISGKVYAPNGVDPLPNAIVFVPTTEVMPFTPGVSCESADQQISGSPIATATTAADGSFTLQGVPSGTDIPLVVQLGRWRRQVVIPAVAACSNTALPAALTHLPTSQAEGDIPKIAMVTGYADGLECVLRKIGIADSEFTNPSGKGRIGIFQGSGAPGAFIDTNTPTEDQLESSSKVMNQYDQLIFACQGAPYVPSAAYQTNLVNYADAGGRVLLTHFGYVWLYDNGLFAGTADWDVNQAHDFTSDPETAGVVETLSSGAAYPEGVQLANWLKDVGASTTEGEITIGALRKDQNGVVSPVSQSWLSITDQTYTNSVMQFTFNTPVGASQANQCGRVMFNEYHIENQTLSTPVAFPTECGSGPLTPGEKLVEFSLFNLSAFIATGSPPTLALSFVNAPARFKQGDSADTIAIDVANTGTAVAATSSLSIAIALPSGLSAKSLKGSQSGTGWNCESTTLTCSRTTGLNAKASDPITLTVGVSSSAPAGTGSSIAATLSGGGLLGAVTAKDSITIDGQPAIRWPEPKAIVYGTPLSRTQLNASTTVAGVFTYTPAVGKVLSAGSQTLSVTFTPTDKTNYTAVTAKVTLLVGRAELTVSAKNASRLYGKANPAFSPLFSGFVNKDTAASATSGKPVLTTSATAKSTAGAYSIKAGAGTLAAKNYAFKFVSGTLTVTKAPLTVAAANASAVVDQPLPKFTYTATGFVNGDTKSVLSGAPAETTTAKQGSPAGTYSIDIKEGTLKATNYSFVFKNGTLTIKAN